MTAKRGPLTDVLRDALADLADCELDDVEVSVSAPGLDPSAEVALELTLVGDDAAADDESAAAAAPEQARAEQPQDRGGSGRGRKDRGGNGANGSGRAAMDDRADRADRADRGVQDAAVSLDELDEEADAAADFMEGLLDALDLPGDLKIRVDDDHAEVEVFDVNSGALIGRRGQTLEAIQELVRCALQREFQRRARVKIEVEGYRARRLEKLREKALEAIEEALDTGEQQRLEPMDVFERKAVHRLVAEHDGVTSRSHGREPARRVVIEVE